MSVLASRSTHKENNTDTYSCLLITRLPSNLRPTTIECVHLVSFHRRSKHYTPTIKAKFHTFSPPPPVKIRERMGKICQSILRRSITHRVIHWSTLLKANVTYNHYSTCNVLLIGLGRWVQQDLSLTKHIISHIGDGYLRVI